METDRQIPVPREDLETLASLAQAHIFSSNPERTILSALQLSREIGQPITDACLLRYDLSHSEEVFQTEYDSSVTTFHLAARKVSEYFFGVGWQSIEGDRALLLTAPKLNPSLVPEQTFINSCRCAMALQQLLKNPLLVRDRLFGSDYRGNEFDELARVLTNLLAGKRSQLALKLGITSVGQVNFTSHLAEIKANDSQGTQSIIELERILNLSGPFLLRNQQTEKLLRTRELDSNDQLICLDPSLGIYLVRLDRIPGEKYGLPGWQLVVDPDFKPEELAQFKENIAQVRTVSSHNHAEGSFPPTRYFNSPDNRMIHGLKFVGLLEFIRQINTWRIQVAMALAFENPTLPEEFREIVDKLIREKFPDQEITDQEKAMMAVAIEVGRQVDQTLGAKSGRVLVSPFNVAYPDSLDPSFSTLTEEHLPPRVRENLKGHRLPEDFQLLNFKKYLTALKEGLGPLEIVVSLRRDGVEKEILTYSDEAKTNAFIQELKELQQEDIIVNVDFSGDEKALSVKEMERFIKELKDNGLLGSIHVGEMVPEDTAQGLENIIDSVNLGIPTITHAFSLWYLLTAEENNQALKKQRGKIDEIASGLGLEKGTSYQKIASKIIEKLFEQQTIIQVCLASNLCTCLQNDSGSGPLYQRLLRHPLIEVLATLAKHPDEQITLPQMQLGFDDCVATQLYPEEEIQAFIYALLEKGCSLTQVHQLIEKYFIDSLK